MPKLVPILQATARGINSMALALIHSERLPASDHEKENFVSRQTNQGITALPGPEESY